MSDLREELARALMADMARQNPELDIDPVEMYIGDTYSNTGYDAIALADAILPIIERERAAERAKIVAFLRQPRTGMGYVGVLLADAIESGDHVT